MQVRVIRVAVATLFLFGTFAVNHAEAADIRIIAPYAGFISNVTEREAGGSEIVLEDTDLMLGLYAQWIRPGGFQGNVFLYHAPDVNFSKLWGFHSNLDFYFSIGEIDNLVIGGGLELISIHMDAQNEIPGLQNFTLQTTVVAPYLRVGRQFPFGDTRTNLVIFPWVGGEVDIVRGNVSFFVPIPFDPPGIDVTERLDATDLYGLAGINLRATLWHFLQVDAKYSGAFDAYTFLPRASVMVNGYFTRTVGLSYRFSVMETTAGDSRYHIFGVSLVF
jgi:hypothetical protein